MCREVIVCGVCSELIVCVVCRELIVCVLCVCVHKFDCFICL